jgi:DNA-binding GntR family transcriptional regulator
MARTLADSIGGTVRQRTVRELRDRILTGTVRAGTRLDLDAISEEFGISRTPVREALLELSFQGLVDIAPRSGVTVIGVTPAEVLDNFAILATLSGKAAEWAAARIGPASLAELARQAEELALAPVGPGLIEANWQFHRIINEAGGSKHLLSLIRQAVRLIPSNYLAVIPVRAHDGIEHEQLLHYLTRGDAAAARAVAEQHVLAAGASVAGWLAEQAPGVGADEIAGVAYNGGITGATTGRPGASQSQRTAAAGAR